MKILITGHKGFIGQNAVKHFSKSHQVITFEWGDEFPKISGLDWVVHMGAISSTIERDVERVLQQNLDFSINLYEHCKFYKVNFQYSSSASVYGLVSSFREDAPLDPRSPYAWSKYLLERYIKNNPPTQTVAQGFRYFNVYGPGEGHKDQPSPHHRFEKEAEETGVIKLFEGSENFKRDFVPVSTVIDIHEKFFKIKESGVWNIGTGRPQSFKHIAQTIAEGMEARIEYIPMPENVRAQYQTYTCADLTKLRKTLDDASNG